MLCPCARHRLLMQRLCLRQLQGELIDVNKSFFDEVDRHGKAMAAIYARHSETSSSEIGSGISTPEELR
jgi:hypothetical protein